MWSTIHLLITILSLWQVMLINNRHSRSSLSSESSLERIFFLNLKSPSNFYAWTVSLLQEFTRNSSICFRCHSHHLHCLSCQLSTSTTNDCVKNFLRSISAHTSVKYSLASNFRAVLNASMYFYWRRVSSKCAVSTFLTVTWNHLACIKIYIIFESGSRVSEWAELSTRATELSIVTISYTIQNNALEHHSNLITDCRLTVAWVEISFISSVECT